MAGDTEFARTPPHSEEAEQSLLGALLIDSTAYGAAAAIVEACDFYRHENRSVFEAVGRLVAVRAAVDAVTVFEQLKAESPSREFPGALQYLHALAVSVPSAAAIRTYAQMVRERAVLRRLIAASDEIAAEAFNPQGRAVADIISAGQARLRTIAEAAPAANSLPILGPTELGALPPQQWLVKRTIPAEAVGVMYGGSGAFKSFIALDLALHVAHGLRWLDHPTVAGDVLMVVGEGAGGIKGRSDAWHSAKGRDPDKARLFVLPVAVDMLADAHRVAEAAESRGARPVLVIVDTLSTTFRGEENSAGEVAAYLATMGAAFRDRWNATVVVIHHTGHQHERPRGSSTLRANVDFLLGVFRDKNEMLATMGFEKMKDGAEPDDISFQLHPVPLGEDEDGEPISGLAAFHVRTAAELREIVAEQAERGRKGYHARIVELARDGMKERELRAAFYEACEHLGSTDSKSKAFRRALQWATNSNLLGVVDGHVKVVGRLAA